MSPAIPRVGMDEDQEDRRWQDNLTKRVGGTRLIVKDWTWEPDVVTGEGQNAHWAGVFRSNWDAGTANPEACAG